MSDSQTHKTTPIFLCWTRENWQVLRFNFLLWLMNLSYPEPKRNPAQLCTCCEKLKTDTVWYQTLIMYNFTWHTEFSKNRPGSLRVAVPSPRGKTRGGRVRLRVGYGPGKRTFYDIANHTTCWYAITLIVALNSGLSTAISIYFYCTDTQRDRCIH